MGPDGQMVKRKHLGMDEEFMNLVTASFNRKKKVIRDWNYINPDPQHFLDQQKKRKEMFASLEHKLAKFVAKRSISFNLELVFKKWVYLTTQWNKEKKGYIKTIGKLRTYTRGQMSKD